MTRACKRCGQPLPAEMRSHARHCSAACRAGASRAQNRVYCVQKAHESARDPAPDPAPDPARRTVSSARVRFLTAAEVEGLLDEGQWESGDLLPPVNR